MDRKKILNRLKSEHLEGFQTLTDIVSQNDKFIITAHFSPDGDNIGSCLAMYHYLKDQGKDVVVLNEDPVPSHLKFLDPDGIIQNPGETGLDTEPYEIAVVLDSGDLHRIGTIQDYVKNKKTVNIDHHKSNTSFADINILDFTACATAELIYSFLIFVDYSINETVAYQLFTAIATDTGFFRYQSMHKEVYEIAADLMECGVDPSFVNQKVYQSREPGFLKLLGRALDSIEWHCNNQLAIATIKLEDFEDAKTLDTEGIVNQIGIVNTVEVFVLVREKEPGVVSASLRSKNYVDVSDAVESLGGGGHARAAGCRTKDMSLLQFRDALIAAVKPYIKN